MTKNFYKVANRLALIIILASFYQGLSAQGFVWVKSFGGAGKDKGKDLGVDQFGNQYLAGFYTDEMTLGSTTLHTNGNPGDEDIFITKIDDEGNPLWAHSMGNGMGIHEDYPFGLSVNDNGFSAATGKFADYVMIDSGDTIHGFGQDDMWLIAYDPDGNLDWLKSGGGPNTDMGSAAYVDNDQNVYCAGNFKGPIDFFGDTMLAVSNGEHIYCAKYDWSGNLLWIKLFDSQSKVQVHDLLVNASGDIYLSGNFNNNISFDAVPLTSHGDGDGFIVKMKQGGAVLWATSFGSSTATSFETGSTITLDQSGNCYVASTFAYDCNFIGADPFQTNDVKNVLLAKYDANGNYIWSNALRGGPGVKFSPITLSVTAEDTILHNILLSGIFSGVDTVGSIILQPYTSIDSADAFIASFTADGAANWAINMGGPSHDGAFGIKSNNSDYAYATGNYRFSGKFGTINLLSNGESDIWVAKFQKNNATGITSVKGNESFQAFPNPFSSQLIVAMPLRTTEMTIYNSIGQVVMHRTVAKTDKQLSLDFNPSSGMYTIQLKGEYGITTGKIEKQ